MSLQVWQPQVEWGWEVAAYLFFIGIGTGAYMAAVVARRMNKEKYDAFSETGIHLSWILTLISIAFLFLHLGRPERFINVYANPASWMTLGAWLTTLFVGVGILSSLFLTRVRVSEGTNSAVQIMGFFIALPTAIYTGILIAVLNAKPLWYSPFIPWLFVASELVTGIVATDLVLLYREKQRDVVSEISLRIVELVITLTVIELVLIAAFSATGGAREMISLVISGALSPILPISVLLMGMFVPLLLSIYASYSEDVRSVNTFILTLIYALVLIGAFLLRYAVLLAGQLS